MPAPKKLHDALNDLWDIQKEFAKLKNASTRDVNKIAEVAKKNLQASDKFEQLLNGRK